MRAFLRLLIITLTLLPGFTTKGQSLYSRAFGKPGDEPIIFLHGGPGSSAVYFEATTAPKLADEGFYVIIYDRRGEGRSKDSTARMNYEEFFEDLNTIYQKYHLSRAHLIGFSFGGLVTTLYAEKHPEKVKSIILASALVSQQTSYNTILQSVERIYRVETTRQISHRSKASGKWIAIPCLTGQLFSRTPLKTAFSAFPTPTWMPGKSIRPIQPTQ